MAGTYRIYCEFTDDKVSAVWFYGKDDRHPLSLAEAKKLLITVNRPELGYKWDFIPRRESFTIMGEDKEFWYYIWTTKATPDGTGLTVHYDTAYEKLAEAGGEAHPRYQPWLEVMRAEMMVRFVFFEPVTL
jgi:hypothetical protein